MKNEATNIIFVVDETLAKRVLDTVDAGLVSGIGDPIPGQMCVEAAVCYAMGLEHSDKPTCVTDVVRRFKIELNDSVWLSKQSRAAGLRKIAIAQLGSRDAIVPSQFIFKVRDAVARRILPIALRNLGLFGYADRLEAEGVATDSEVLAACYQTLLHHQDRSGGVVAYAMDAFYAFMFNLDEVGAPIARVASMIRADTMLKGGRDPMTYFYSKETLKCSSEEAEKILNIGADIGLQALIELGSPGCQFLYLCDNDKKDAS